MYDSYGATVMETNVNGTEFHEKSPRMCITLPHCSLLPSL
jgi:hypothetical protein